MIFRVALKDGSENGCLVANMFSSQGKSNFISVTEMRQGKLAKKENAQSRSTIMLINLLWLVWRLMMEMEMGWGVGTGLGSLVGATCFRLCFLLDHVYFLRGLSFVQPNNVNTKKTKYRKKYVL